jgi:hypothetical protein
LTPLGSRVTPHDTHVTLFNLRVTLSRLLLAA